MHYLLLVTMNKKAARNSKEACKYVYEWLSNNNFACEGGIFCSGMADWFVIGGRWSGILTLCHLNQRKLNKFLEEFEKKHGWWTGGEVTHNKRWQVSKELFKKYFPDFKGVHPFWRDAYFSRSTEDDAMICDKAIFYMMIRKAFYYSGHFCDIEFEAECEPKKFIGKKWVVVVDYHS